MLLDNDATNLPLENVLSSVNTKDNIKLKKIQAPSEFETQNNYIFQLMLEGSSSAIYLNKENDQLLFFYKESDSIKKIALSFSVVDEIEIQMPEEIISDNVFKLLRMGINAVQGNE